MGEARRKAGAGAQAPLPAVVHVEPFAYAEQGQEPTHVVRQDRDFVILKPHWLSPLLDYQMTLYEDGTARISRLDEKSSSNP